MDNPPSADNWLGTDDGGRDVFGQLMLGTRNSFTIGICVTLIAGIFGLTVGLIAGFYGGIVDNIIMRIIDFLMVLPSLMIIIVFVVIVPNYTIFSFILIMSAFAWFGKARLIRSRGLAERELDYINASKTLGTPSWKIMFFEIVSQLKFPRHSQYDTYACREYRIGNRSYIPWIWSACRYAFTWNADQLMPETLILCKISGGYGYPQHY